MASIDGIGYPSQGDVAGSGRRVRELVGEGMVGPTLDKGAVTDLERVKARREQLLALASRHGALNVRVFGSVARGDADAASDLDLLVDLEPGRSLIDLGSLLVALEAELGCRVDLVTEAGLRPALAQRVLREAVPL